MINASLLAEGYHFLSVITFRHRSGEDAPLFREFRRVIYLDRVGPEVELSDLGAIESDEHEFSIRALDRTAIGAYLLLDVPPEVDPLSLIGQENMATRSDRFQWRKTLLGLTHGFHSLTLVAVEATGKASVRRYDGVFVDVCAADFNDDAALDLFDFLAFFNAFTARDPEADLIADGVFDLFDFLAFQNLFVGGCG